MLCWQPHRQSFPLRLLLVELFADPFRPREISSTVPVPKDPARSDPLDVPFQSFGRLRFDALLASVDLGAVDVFDEGEGVPGFAWVVIAVVVDAE